MSAALAILDDWDDRTPQLKPAPSRPRLYLASSRQDDGGITTYDTLGNVTTRTDNFSGLNETFAYNTTLNRLIRATNSGSASSSTTFAYDAIGNLTCKSDISACSASSNNYIYNPSGQGSVRPHAVASITGTINGVVNPAFNYDANGNLIDGAGRTITWTSYNMATGITRGVQSDTFLYNAEHERVKQTQADGTEIGRAHV